MRVRVRVRVRVHTHVCVCVCVCVCVRACATGRNCTRELAAARQPLIGGDVCTRACNLPCT